MTRFLTAAFSLVLTATALAQAPFEEGKHYFEIDQPPAAGASDKVVVSEVFSYLCSHCNTFDPYVETWRKTLPEYAEFERVPVVFGRREWELYAKAYVAAETMGIADKAHEAMMDHTWKGQKLMRSMEEMAEFYSQFGVGRDAFLSTANSFAVDAAMRRDQKNVAAYGVRGTPTMIVDGRYRVVNSPNVPDYETMLAVVSYLVEMNKPAAPAAAATGD